MVETRVRLLDVKEVRTGITTPVLKKKKNGQRHKAHLYVSLILPYGSLDLECKNEQQRDLLLVGVLAFLSQEHAKALSSQSFEVTRHYEFSPPMSKTVSLQDMDGETHLTFNQYGAQLDHHKSTHTRARFRPVHACATALLLSRLSLVVDACALRGIV